MQTESHTIFLTGGTGYIGSRLSSQLLSRGHTIKALTRKPDFPHKDPVAGYCTVFGNALEDGYAEHITASDTFIHLVGVSHPSPAKASEFRSIDLKSLEIAVKASRSAQIKHFIFISVAHPAPAMKAYISVREECEQIIRESGLNATILRPWYVLGPGHRWPYVLLPMYWLMERIPATQKIARRLGLVTLDQMLKTLVSAVENPCQGTRILEVPQIRRGQVVV